MSLPADAARGAPRSPGPGAARRATTTRWVVYVDIDAFYVSCETRDRPELDGRPVIVGRAPTGPESRGVVLSASYAARAYGVRSAMPVVLAARRCPEAVWVAPDFSKYERAAEEIRRYLGRWAESVIPLSIDEAALEVDLPDPESALAWARDVQAGLASELKLPSSIGLSPYAVVAKIASDAAKPGGIKVVPADRTEEFLRELPVGAVPGIGPKSSERLARVGLHTIGELALAPVESTRKVLGRFADAVRELALGRPGPALARLPEETGPRQHSLDRTFDRDLSDPAEVEENLSEMSRELATILAQEGLRYQLVVVRVRWADFSQVQRGRQLPASAATIAPLVTEATRLLREILERERQGPRRAVRRLSLSAGKLTARRGHQAPLDSFPARPASR